MEIDLDEVILSMAAVVAWQELARRIATAMQMADVSIDPQSIPDERARIETDGTLTIFVAVPQLGEVSIAVPSGQWAHKR